MKSLGLEERFTIEYVEKEAVAMINVFQRPYNATQRALYKIVPHIPTDSDLEIVLKYIKYQHKGEPMDKQINKVKKDVEKHDEKKAKKDIGTLLKMDKKFDAKLEKCDKKMGKK